MEIIVFNWSDDDFGAVRLFRLSLKASLYCVLRTQEIIVHLVLPVRNKQLMIVKSDPFCGDVQDSVYQQKRVKSCRALMIR